MKNCTPLALSEARKHYSVGMAAGARSVRARRNQPMAAAFSDMADQQAQRRAAILAAAAERRNQNQVKVETAGKA